MTVSHLPPICLKKKPPFFAFSDTYFSHFSRLYFRETIEEDAYRTLQTRIRLFEDVVGPLQPILAEMPRIMGRVARGEIEREEAQRLLDDAAKQQSKTTMQPLEAFTQTPGEVQTPVAVAGTVCQDHLAAWCLIHLAPGMSLNPVPEPGTAEVNPNGIRACFKLVWQFAPIHLGLFDEEAVLVTFNGELADRHPPTAQSGDEEEQITRGSKEGVRLLTWGDPLLTAWLEAYANPRNAPACGES